MQTADDSDLELTHRELQVLELVVQGYSAKEAAQIIKIAPRTVERHIDTIRLKLRARNRAHMVAKAIAANLVTVDGHLVVRKAAKGDGTSRLVLVQQVDPVVVHQPCLQVVGGAAVAAGP